MAITTIGMDTSKSVFQVDAVVLPLMTGPRIRRDNGEWKKVGLARAANVAGFPVRRGMARSLCVIERP